MRIPFTPQAKAESAFGPQQTTTNMEVATDWLIESRRRKVEVMGSEDVTYITITGQQARTLILNMARAGYVVHFDGWTLTIDT